MRYFILLLFPILLFNCNKDHVSPTTSTDTTEVSTALPTIGIEELTLKFKNGVPFYNNAREFNQALVAVSRASGSIYVEWANSHDFKSNYFNLTSALERAETENYTFVDSDLDYILPLDEGGAIQNPYNYYARLSDERGLLYIDDDIHFFSGRKHVLVDGGTPDQIVSELNATETRPEDGVYIWEYDQPSYMEGEEVESNAKIQREFLNCPFELGRSAASSFSEFDDLWWQRVIHNGGIGRTDEQRIGCSRRSCRQGTWGFLNTVMTVTNANSNGYTISSVLMYAFDNRRRSGWNWIRTFPDVKVERGLFNNGARMQYTLEVTESNSSGQSSTVNLGSESMIDLDEIFGTAEENVAITNGLTFNVQFSVSSPSNVLRKMIIDSGRASHKWDRGNSGADPISIEFRCD